MKTFIYLIFTLCLTSCKADLDRILGVNKWQTYTIKEGNHYSDGHDIRANTLSTCHLDFYATFNETAIYTLEGRHNFDLNKLYGFSDCNAVEHVNSARFGWCFNIARNALEIHAYVYNNGTLNYQYIADAVLNEPQSYSIYCVGDHYNFNFNGNLITMPRGHTEQHCARFLLYPYFGGDETAPHQVNIQIKLL